MVGGLVEDHEVNILHKGCSQIHSAALTTGKSAHNSIETQFHDAESAKHVADFGVGRPLIGFKAEWFNHGVGNSDGFIQVKALGDHGHAQPRIMGHTPRVRLFDAGKYFQQSGFTAAVNADDANAVARLNAQGDLVQQGFEAERFGYCF